MHAQMDTESGWHYHCYCCHCEEVGGWRGGGCHEQVEWDVLSFFLLSEHACEWTWRVVPSMWHYHRHV